MATDSHTLYGLDLAMRGERPRKIDYHWVLDVVSDNLKARMEKDGRSAAKLGQDAKVGRKSVERLRDGKNATLTTLGAVADALGCESPVELMLVRQRTPLVSGNAPRHKESYSVNTAKRNQLEKRVKSGKN